MSFALTKNTKYPAGVNVSVNITGNSGVLPLDTGTILGTVPPGKAGLKLTDGTQQSAATRTCSSIVPPGNAYGPSQDAQGNIVTNSTYQGQPKGYSLGIE